MRLFGLTGGVGMGKSTSAELLGKHGIRVIDTDEIAREVVAPPSPALAEIQNTFGTELVGSDGQLRREALAELVFGDPEKLRRLEAILHPRIRERWLLAVGKWRSEDVAQGVVVIPLLYETDAASYFDRVICVACSPGSQRERLLQRGWTTDQINQRTAAQWPVEEKMLLADHVVWTDGPLQIHEAQLGRIFGFSPLSVDSLN